MLGVVVLAAHVVGQVFLLFAVFLATLVAFGLIVVLVFLRVAVQLVLIRLVRVVAELVAIAQLFDDLPRLLGEGGLILDTVAQRLWVGFQMPVEEILPDVQHVLGRRGQGPSSQLLAQQEACGFVHRGLGGFLHRRIAALVAFGGQAGVEVVGAAVHGAGADGLAARGLQRVEDRPRGLARWGVARVGRRVVEPLTQGKCVRRAARQHHLGPGHPARDLGQPQPGIGAPRRVGGIGDVKLGLARQRPGRLAERLLERVCRVVGFENHGQPRLIEAALSGNSSPKHFW